LINDARLGETSQPIVLYYERTICLDLHIIHKLFLWVGLLLRYSLPDGE